MEPSVPRISPVLSFFGRAILVHLMGIRINKTTCRRQKGEKRRNTEDFIRNLKWVRNCVYSFNLNQGM
jgi:hypothetical protein